MQGVLAGNAKEQLRLAQLHIQLAPEAPPVQAARCLDSALKILHELSNLTSPPAQVAVCQNLAQEWKKVVGLQIRAHEDLAKAGESVDTAQLLAKEYVPKPTFLAVERRSNLSLAEYRDEYLSKGKPVIITDYAARILGTDGRRWSWSDVKKACGETEIHLVERSELANHRWAGLRPSKLQRTLTAWLDEVRAGKAPNSTYLFDWALVWKKRCEPLMEQLMMPKYFVDDLMKRMRFGGIGSIELNVRDFFEGHPSLFVGGAGSGGTLHVDGYASTFWQVLFEGKKTVDGVLTPETRAPGILIRIF
eukprot:gnl/TRDRNA2_/TRDRNA2_175081_c1_seq1.p1 gnl/TRDRNA2_/TRDRNA2_175081_c1~~gnl/TRDRNA2_/TRDRNA2_175081_c1_seq1.p1  ORF type:complete len:305 (-),score=44.00 gnl/TRDRNA2_/TRDRNA2_175081_c1_seq1:82-996(-)